MKLFIYDGKHEQIIGELDLGNLDINDKCLVRDIVTFLDKQGFTDRYKQLVLAKSYKETKDEEGFSEIEFE